MTAIDKLAARLEGVRRELLDALLSEAQQMILAYTGRKSLPAVLDTACVQLAVVLYNRQGIEGQSAHAEGGVSRTMQALPEEIRRQILPYRLAKVVKMSADEVAAEK